MDSDDGEDPACIRVRVPLALIEEVAMSIMDTISEWHLDNDSPVIEYMECIAVINSAASAAIELVGRRPPKKEMMQ
jgi:hypothetical protein